MKTITFLRENNYLTMHRPYKIFVDNEFVDYIEPKEKEKTIDISDSANQVKIMVNKFSSNSIKLNKGDVKKINITSQIQNGLFIFISFAFLGGLLSKLFGFLNNNYLLLSLIAPFGIIVYWQTIGKSNYLRISKR